MADDPARVDPQAPWITHLEKAHRFAHEAARFVEEQVEPSAHLAPAARQLERGIVSVYDAFSGQADRPTALSLAHTRLWDAAVLVARAGLPEAVSSLRGACSELVTAEERFAGPSLALHTSEPLRASNGRPRLHSVKRTSLAPSFRAPALPETTPELLVPEIPEPTTFEELAAAAETMRRVAQERAEALARKPELSPKAEAPSPATVPAGFAEAPRAPLTEPAFVRRWARECLEEIGMLGIQRAPLLGDDWRECQVLDTRLVSAVDAIAALGATAVAYAEPFAMDAPVADPMRVFAVTLVAGCIEGRDALGGAERVLHRFGPGDELVAGAFVAALKLVPNPYAQNVARSLFTSTDLASRAIGLEVLAYRQWLTPEELDARVAEPEPRLIALALPAFAAARHPDLDRVLTQARGHADPRVQEAVLDAMALAAHPDAAVAAREAAAGELGDRALGRLAIVGDEDDARWLLARMQADPSPAAIEAVGWAGLLDAVPPLLDLLEADDEEAQLAAGAALARLLGAELVDEIEVQPEALDDVPVKDPDPDPPPARQPLAELVSDPRDKPPEGSTETLEVPSPDADKWRAYWAEHGKQYDSNERLRRGQPYSPSVSLYELDQLALTPFERRRLHRELAAHTGKLTHFDPHDFVVVQEQSLQQWATIVAATTTVPGAWSRPTRFA